MENEQLYAEDGLGYGIDVTTDHPWKNRGPFIPRPITSLKDVQRKKEPSALQQYHRDIVSGKDISLSVSANLSAIDTSLIKMGVDAEVSRSRTYALHAVGSKIHTHTIDFVTDTSSELTYFENTLRQQVEYSDSIDQEDLKHRCKTFVSKHRCTHYVRAIMYGAVEYEVLTHEEFNRIYSAKGELGVQELGATASVGGGLQHQVKWGKTKGQRLQIGRWDESNQVVKSEVIEVEITPVETLIKTAKLTNALASALREYHKEKLQKRPIGPFLIKCRSPDHPLYLKEVEDSEGRVSVTENKEEATKFSLSLDKIKHPTVFSICVFTSGGPRKCLTCDRFFGGRSPPNKPPVLAEGFREGDVQMSLKDQLLEKGNRIDPQEWIDSGNWFVIRCSHRRRLKVGSRLCIRRASSGEYELAAVPSIRYQGKESFMQFGLESVPVESFEYNYKYTPVANF